MLLRNSRKLVFGADFGCCVPRTGAESAQAAYESRDLPLYTNPSPQQEDPDSAQKDAEPTGVLITNLGTPAAPTSAAVRRYLAEFLSDPRVVELPRWLWLPILYAVILPLRPRRSAAAYREIWTGEGSPLLVNARRQAAALEDALAGRWPGGVKVALGMRYGAPSIATALTTLRDWGARRVLVLPLYPQYSATTTGSTYDALFHALSGERYVPDLRIVSRYHDHPQYIDALANSVRAAREQNDRHGRLLFSFHGLPQRYCDAGDPYYEQCLQTAQLVADRLGEAPENWAVAFQSRVGREKWLQPYTESLLCEWAKAGVGTVHVVCPGFSADCLETLEEIAIRAAALFRSCGGEALHYIPALNDRPDHIAALADIVTDQSRPLAGNRLRE
jgi:ferrochelatase